jgi:hypothetical protein
MEVKAATRVISEIEYSQKLNMRAMCCRSVLSLLIHCEDIKRLVRFYASLEDSHPFAQLVNISFLDQDLGGRTATLEPKKRIAAPAAAVVANNGPKAYWKELSL